MPVTGPAALDERPRRRRAALLAAPWVLALALGVAALLGRPGASASSPGAATSPATAPAALSATPATPTESAQPVPSATSVTADAVPATTHLQVLAQARIALGTAGLTSEEGGRSDVWPIEVRLAGIARVTDTLAIATVHALVIELADSGWTGPLARAVAVPLTMTPEPRVAGPAWPITAPPSAVVAPDGAAIDDPDPAVLTPLQRAGWTVEELTSADLVGGAVLRIGLVGVPPDHVEPGHHVVWLLDAPGGPRLLPLEATGALQATDPTQEST